MVLPSAHQQNPDCDMWVHEYFTPSWFCLPNNRSVLTVVRPGDSARDTLEGVCKVRPWGRPGEQRPRGSPPQLACGARRGSHMQGRAHAGFAHGGGSRCLHT